MTNSEIIDEYYSRLSIRELVACAKRCAAQGITAEQCGPTEPVARAAFLTAYEEYYRSAS